MLSKGILNDVSNSLRQHNVLPKTLFERLDSNRRGVLSRDDLYLMVLTYRPNIDAMEFDELFWQMNRSCSGEITFAEFCGALGFSAEPSGLDPFLQDIVRRIHNSLRDMNVGPEQLFQRLDANSANSLGPAEISHMVRCFNHQLNKVELDNLYRHFSAGSNVAVDLRMFCRALGFSTGSVNVSFGANNTGAGLERISQVARSLQAKGTGLQDAFRLFDSNNDGLLDRDEFHRLLSTCDPGINQFESDDVFSRAAPQGHLSFQQFAQAFQLSSTASQNASKSLGYWMKTSPPSKLDPTLRSLLNHIGSWLEPALLSQCLGLTGESRVSRAGFDQMVQAIEPQLRPGDLDRLFQQTGAAGSGEIVIGDFIRRFGSDTSWMTPGPGTDQWALSVLRRVARRAASALSVPQDLFKKYSIAAAGIMTRQEFANMVRQQFPAITLAEVDALWNFADADRNGRVDLYEFSTAIRFLALEAQDTTSSINNPPALGTARDQVIEARITQLARCLAERGMSLSQAFLPFDMQGTGFVDRATFQRLLGMVGLNLAEWEVNEIIAWFDTAREGRINYQDLVRRFDASAQARATADAYARASAAQEKSMQATSAKEQTAWYRVAQVLEQWKMQGCTIYDAFRFFDNNQSGNLDCQEFFRLMITCEPSINQYESNDIFTKVAGANGHLDIQKFGAAFGLSADVLGVSSATASKGFLPPRVDPAMQSVVNRLYGWLEPALLSRTLGITGQSRLSRDDFNRVVLALEPQLSTQDLDRLFQQVNTRGTGIVDVTDFVQQVSGGVGLAPGPGADQWALALLRRVGKRMNKALAANQDILKLFDFINTSGLSQLDFERMVRMQDGNLSQADVDKLWRLADSNGDGRVDLQEFYNCLRQVQLEAEDAASWASGAPATLDQRDRVVEVRLAQLARCCDERNGWSLAQAFALFDRANVGSVDRNVLIQLFCSVGLNLADWEINEIIIWGDTARDGRLNYRELLRQYGSFFQANATADAQAAWQQQQAAFQANATAEAQPASSKQQTAWNRVAQVLEQWKMQGCTIHDAFRFFDNDRTGNLDCQEFFRLMVTCEPSINQYESNDIFTRVAGANGHLDIQKFGAAFGLSADALGVSSATASKGFLPPRVDPAMQAVVNRLYAWLEPALLSRTLGITGQSRLSRDEFNRVVLALEPQLSAQDLDRLFQQVNTGGTGVVDVNTFVRQVAGSGVGLAPGPGADQWAMALLRRVGKRMNLALGANQDLLRLFDFINTSGLSKMDLERMVRMHDGNLSQADIDKLWCLADNNGDGRVDLQEFYNCLRQVQLEAEDAASWASGAPATVEQRDRVVEVRLAQLARCCSERNGWSLAQAFALFDRANVGSIDRNVLIQLFCSVGLNIADWEINEIIIWGDTSRDGRLNYSELLRQYGSFFQAKSTPDAQAVRSVVSNPAISASLNAEAEATVGQIAKRLRDCGINLADVFTFYDADKNGFLERQEFRTILQVIDSSLPDHICEKIFELAAVNGRIDLASFIRRFNVPADLATSAGSLQRPSYAQPVSQLPVETQSVAGQIHRWLEPLMLNRTLSMAGLGRISQAQFQRMVQVVEPNLNTVQFDRLFRQADVIGQGSRDIDSFDFLRRFDREAASLPLGDGMPGAGASTDRWALVTLRRIARRVGPMISSSEHTFRRMDIGGTGMLTAADLHRFLQMQEPALNRQHVESLFQVADSSRKGVVSLQDFCDMLGSVQLEAERSQPAASNMLAGSAVRDRVIEVRGVTLARVLHDRGYGLEKAFTLFDQRKTGFLDRATFRQLLRAANFTVTGWEEDEFVLQCDTAGNGLLDCRELLRRLCAVKLPGSTPSSAGLAGAAPYAAAAAQSAQPAMASTWPASQTSPMPAVAGAGASFGMPLGAAPATMPYTTPGASVVGSTPSFTPAPAAPALATPPLAVTPAPAALAPAGFAPSPLGAPLGAAPMAPAAPLAPAGMLAPAAPLAAAPPNTSVLQSTLSMNPVLNQIVNRLRLSVQVPADQVFRQYDVMGNNTLDALEFERFIRTYEGGISVQDVNTLWRCLDGNGDGRIDFNEFASLLRM